MTTTTPNPRKEALVNDLVGSIRNEQNYFDMSQWTTNEDEGAETARVSCETASCIAGHLWAIRPGLAAQAVVDLGHRWSFDQVAAKIWCAETGDAFCPLDFYASNLRLAWGASVPLSDIAREDAIAHILGTSPDWPQREPSGGR